MGPLQLHCGDSECSITLSKISWIHVHSFMISSGSCANPALPGSGGSAAGFSRDFLQPLQRHHWTRWTLPLSALAEIAFAMCFHGICGSACSLEGWMAENRWMCWFMFLCFLLGAYWVGAKNHVNMSSAHAPHLRWNWPPFWCCWTCWMKWKSWVTIVGTGKWSGNPGLVAPKNWLVKMLFLTISGGGTWCPAAWVCCIIGVQGSHNVLLVCTISAMLHGQAHEHVSFSWALPARASERTWY